jgi:hypothetical protein
MILSFAQPPWRDRTRGCIARSLALLGCAVSLVLAPGVLRAEDIVISTGNPGGYYHWMGVRLGIAFMNVRGPLVLEEQSKGSLENLARLDNPNSPANLGFTQADAYRHYVEANPSFESEVVVLTDFGSECIFLITSQERGIKSVDDLRKPSEYAISVGSAESGPAITFDVLRSLDPSLNNTPITNLNPMQALLELQNPDLTKVKTLMLVQRARSVSPPLEVVLDNPDLYRIVSIKEGDRKNAKGPDGKQIYTSRNVQIGFGKDHSVSFDTVCTRGFLVAAKNKLEPATLEQISSVLLEQGRYIMPRSRD